jgi:AraC-like DNA-binding protein
MEPTYIDPRIANAIQILKKDPFCPLQDLALRWMMSTSRLTHIFKQETGGTIKQYRHNHRLQEAARVLTVTAMSIKEIAYHLAYQHTSSFVRAFKAEFEVSPAYYRRRSRAKAVA